jgi:inosine-uridine nucleoside N-ribohydrolase
MAEQTLIWLDCDPGHDDAFALMLAAMHPGSKLIGVSTSGGNQTVEKVTRNALDLLHLCGLDDVPCVRGNEHALMETTVPCPEIHGESGLDTHCGAKFPPHSLEPVPEKALHFMARTILAQPRKVTLIATGRQTNVALLLTVYPEVMRNVAAITIMGGAMRGGNTHPVAEFNIQGDPEAAQIVLNFGMHGNDALTVNATKDWSTVADADLRVPIVYVTLEVTHTVLVTDAVLAQLQRHTRAAGAPPLAAVADAAAAAGAAALPSTSTELSQFGRLMTSLFLFFAGSYRDHFGFAHGPPLHDPLAVLFPLRPELFKYKHWRVDVECARSHSRGQTVVDVWGQTGRPANAFVCESVDVSEFWRVMEGVVARVNTVAEGLYAATAAAESAAPGK